jgi:hypothetical protein
MGSNDYMTPDHGHKDFGFEKPDNGQNNWHSGNMGFMMGRQGSNLNSRKDISLEIGLNPYSKKLGDYNKKRELTVGLYYSGFDFANKNSVDFTSTPGDTFSNNALLYQTDTITRIQRSYREEANVLGVSVQYLYKTDPEKRISLFTGYGIKAGYAITARIHEGYTKDSALVVNFAGTVPDNSGFDNGLILASDQQKYSKNAHSTILTSVFIPFGIDLRLCKNKDIWNQMNLFMKGSVGLESDIVVNGKTKFLPYAGCSLGFKFNFK